MFKMVLWYLKNGGSTSQNGTAKKVGFAALVVFAVEIMKLSLMLCMSNNRLRKWY